MTAPNDEQSEALAQATRWCEARGAEVHWDEDETSCRIRVALPGLRGHVEGVGAGYYEAYVECRVRYDVAAAPDAPPSWF